MMIRKLLPLLFALIATPVFADGLKVVTTTRDIARGEVIADADLTIGTAATAALTGTVITDLNAIRGMEARRPLRAGEVISMSDVRRPVVVTKGQTVTMTFDAPGVSLTAMGRAMSEGGVGDTVVVQNPASYRMVNAVITGAGTVRAAGPAAPLKQTTARR
jgi:flagella basal body P-ring formation protein FlgA